jgi:hypothetical protein
MSVNDRANEMLNNWTPETASLIATLKRHKFTIVKGDNGEEVFRAPETAAGMKNFIENLTACDEARLYVKGPNSDRTRWLYLVFGNSPGELVSDYSVPGFGVDAGADPLDAVTEEHSNRWEGRKQPKIRAADLYPSVYGPAALAEQEVHALQNHHILGERAFAANLWIDGTAPDGTYQGDATKGPWVVFDIAAQANIAGPFTSDQEAREALQAILDSKRGAR